MNTTTLIKDNTPSNSIANARHMPTSLDVRGVLTTIEASNALTPLDAVEAPTQASEPDAMTRTETELPAWFESAVPTRTVVVEDLPIFDARMLPTHVISPSPRDEGHYPLLTDHG